MPNNDNVTTFAGLPVVDFDGVDQRSNSDGVDQRANVDLARRDPAAVAWRVSSWEDDDHWEDAVSPTFRTAFEAFLASPVAELTTTLVLGSWGYAAMNGSPVDLVASAAPRLPA